MYVTREVQGVLRISIFGEVCCLFDLVHLLIESSLVAWLWLNRSSETSDKLM